MSDIDREAFLTEYIRNEWGDGYDVDDPELRSYVAGTLGFQLAWLHHCGSALGGDIAERVRALRALRRYWRS